jgi:hypothetical protein
MVHQSVVLEAALLLGRGEVGLGGEEPAVVREWRRTGSAPSPVTDTWSGVRSMRWL